MASFLTIIAAAGMAASMAGLPPAPTQSADGSSGPGGSPLQGATSPADDASGGAPASSPGRTSGTPGASSPAPSAPPEGWTALELPPLPRVARLEPTRSVPAGVLADTAFRLTSLDGSDPAALARTLVAEPPLELRVARSNATEALVQPAAPLRAGARYELALRDPDGTVRGAWSVQAVQPLSVVGTVPGDESTGVPLDTGIEVTFDQDGVALADVRTFITIAPAVDGTWIQQGRTVAFVPDAPLPTGTLYTVTVRHGLPLAGTSMTLEDDVIVRFETRDEAAPNTWITLRHALYDTPTAEGAVIGVNVDEPEDEETEGRDRPSEVAVTMHDLRDVDAAVDAWDAIRRAPGWTLVTGTAPVATDGLPVALDSTLPLRRIEPERDDRLWFRLPAMPAGWYLLTMREHGVPRQAVVQVTDLAVYATVTETRTLAWVHDLATKAPLEGAHVGLLGTSLGRTDGDGVAIATTPAAMLRADEDPGPRVVLARAAGRAAFAPIMAERDCEKCGSYELEPASHWWVVFQPDRYAYRPTDTLNAWGVVRDRESLDVPDRVTVRLLSEWDEMEEPVAVASKRVEPDASGSFLAPLELRDLPYGQYELEVVAGGQVVASREISVDRIVKPAWTVTLGTDRNALLSGQTVRVSAEARFFDGTPVAGAALRFTGGSATRRATTGLLGRATAAVPVGPAGEPEEQWGIHAIEVRPASPEEGAIRADTQVAVFRANVLATVAATVAGERLSATGSVHRVAWSRFARLGDRSLWDIDPFGAALAGRSVRVRVVEHHDIRFQTATQYDFITKQTVPVYDYRTERREVYDETLRTDATGTFRLAMDVNPVDRSFTVTVTATDADGRRTRAVEWASSAGDDDGYAPPAISRDGGDIDDNEYEVGDEVRLRFEPGGGASPEGAYLWTASQAGLREWHLTDSARLRMPFVEESVPGIAIDAVRFTGTGYEAAWQPYLAAFDPADRRLTIKVTPDATRYEPGDTASLVVRTTRPDGTPADASVIVRVVDEKLYEMGLADDEDPLTALYEPIGSGIIASGWTHGTDSEWGDGWGDTTGGGGDRAEFRDWLLARLVRTGEDGRARVPVELSDDITSWHVTAAGVSTRLEAGIGTALIPVGLPFFAEATIAPEYLAADRPVIAVRGFGSALGTGTTVTFRVSSDTLPMAPVTVKAKAFLPAEVALPKLSAGTHRVRIVATTTVDGRARRDVLVRTFKVVPARQVRTVTRTVALTGATPVEHGVGPTTLIVADGGRGRVVPVLDELRWADPGRADRTLAAALAARLLRDELGVDVPDVAALQGDLDRFAAEWGVAVVPWSSGELPLTVLAAMADDPRMRASGMAGYFEPREVDPDQEGPDPEPMTPERQAWTLAGRAATGSMVLSEVRELAAAGRHTVPTRVALALAALLAGDEELAGRIERDVLAEAGFRMGPWVALDTGDEERDAVLTARLAIVAAGLADPLAPDMDAFVGANPPATTTVDLERALAAKAWISRTPAADASAVLVVDGERRTLEVEASRPRLVTLTPAQARTASIEPAGGTVVVTTTTTVAYRTGTLDTPEGLRLSVRVRPTSVDADDLVIVTYTARLPRKPDGCWVLTDMVPSGLMPLGGAGNANEDEDEDGEEEADGDWVFRPESVTGQEVRFCLYLDPDRGRTVTARYVARVVTPGRYRWEPAVLQSSLATELGTATPRRTLTIGRLTR